MTVQHPLLSDFIKFPEQTRRDETNKQITSAREERLQQAQIEFDALSSEVIISTDATELAEKINAIQSRYLGEDV